MRSDGRVVKALDLSSNGQTSAWVRTPLAASVIFKQLTPFLAHTRLHLCVSHSTVVQPKITRVTICLLDMRTMQILSYFASHQQPTNANALTQ